MPKNIHYGPLKGYPKVERGCGFEEIFEGLLHCLPEYTEISWFAPFENDVFSCRFYFEPDCTCGKEDELGETPHDEECSELRKGGGCSCGAWALDDERVNTLEHTEGCRVTIPNFLHKPSGLWIVWYKYPFRASYSNRTFTLPEFTKIVQECIDSLVG